MNRTLIHDTPFALAGARLAGLRAAAFERGLVELAPGRREGLLTSVPVEALFPFNVLVLSVNAELPAGSRLAAEARARRRGRWSPWRVMGLLDAEGGSSLKGPEVDVDTLALKAPADAFQYRLRFRRKSAAGPLLKLVAAAYGDGRTRASVRRSGRGRVLLEVPPRSQMSAPKELRADICSPTSVGMTLEYWGRRFSSVELAGRVRDRGAGIYGNWFLNTAWAGRVLDAYVARLDSLDELEAELRAGRPVVCTVAFGPGELRGAPIPKTRGHLLVVRGVDERGDILAADPAAPSAETVLRTYRRMDFARAWLERKQGVAYVLAPRFPKELAVAVPCAELRRRPRPVASRRDPDQESQLLLGERVRALDAEGAWAYVEALEQIVRGAPYRGWMRADALVRPSGAANRAAARTTLPLSLGKARLLAPAGALLQESGRALGRARLLLPGDRLAFARAAALVPLGRPAPSARGRVLRAMRGFLGQRYFWGGLAHKDVGRGLDCSGLVGVSYRSVGLILPRNAQDQCERAVPLERPLPGDLVFLSKEGDPSQVTHVMVYAGRGRLLEADGRADRVRELSFEAKIGVPFEKARAGGDYKGRRLRYGSFLMGAFSLARGPRGGEKPRRHPALRPPR